MKLTIKEIHADAEYMVDLERYRAEPTIYPKPDKDIKFVKMNLYVYDILSYKVLHDGILEENKPEILISTTFGEIVTDYTKVLESKLDNLMTIIENDFLLGLKELPKQVTKD